MAETYTAILIDDDQQMRHSLELLLDRAGWTVRSFNRAEAALAGFKGFGADVILSDVRMPGMSGIELLETLKERGSPPVVLISAHGDIPTAVDALQKGAYSFLEKPFEPRRLLRVLQHAAEAHRLSRKTHRMREQLIALSGLDRVLLGQDPVVTRLKDTAVDAAVAKGPALLTGETGTGKELLARALHRLGPNPENSFVALNCATLAPDRAEEQIFGNTDTLLGCFRRADRGTLFLDEIAACPHPIQAKLLRAIETGVIQPVGGEEEIRTDVRIVAATNEDLDARVADGSFRSDLFFRLNGFHMHLPPLKDRGEDVILLYQNFVAQLSETYEITAPDVSAEDAAALLSHRWPGNVRELRHVAERRVLGARRGVGSVAEALAMDDLTDDVPATLREAVARFEKTLIGQAIAAHSGRMDAVAEALGIGRRTLNEKIVKLGLDKAQLLD